MNETEWRDLRDGDVVRPVGKGESLMVMGNYRGMGVVLARVTLAHNPREWDLIIKSDPTYPARP